MLIYHFGSKQGLLVAIVRAVEEQQRRSPGRARRRPVALARRRRSPDVAAARRPVVVAQRAPLLRDLRPGPPGPGPHRRLPGRRRGVVARSDRGDAEREGVPAEVAAAQARLDLAVTRGLLLDLLATGDRAGTDAAVEHSITLFESWPATLPDPPLVTATAARPSRRRRRGPTAAAVGQPARGVDELGRGAHRGAGRAGDRDHRVRRRRRPSSFNPDDDAGSTAPGRRRPPRPDPPRRRRPVLHARVCGRAPGAFKNVLDWMIGDDRPALDRREAGRVDQRVGARRDRRPRIAPEGARLRQRRSWKTRARTSRSRLRSSTPRASSRTTRCAPVSRHHWPGSRPSVATSATVCEDPPEHEDPDDRHHLAPEHDPAHVDRRHPGDGAVADHDGAARGAR